MGLARTGVLGTASGKQLSTPILLHPTHHGHSFECENAAFQRLQQDHGQQGIAISAVEMCGLPVMQ